MGFTVGLDLGAARDFSAICVLERIDTKVDYISVDRRYSVRHLQRIRLGTTYPEVVEIVGRLMKALPRSAGQPAPRLVVDMGGVGRPVVDLLRRASLNPIPVTITGGRAEGGSDGSSGYTVPKRNIVSALQVLFQSGKIKVSRDLVFAEDFIRELLEFKVKISQSGHDSYEAARESTHDDLVISCALPVWFNERGVAPAYFTDKFQGYMER
jgi:hypothetical protein